MQPAVQLARRGIVLNEHSGRKNDDNNNDDNNNDDNNNDDNAKMIKKSRVLFGPDFFFVLAFK